MPFPPPSESPTFGCGIFLPGTGPGNGTGFDGGGVIDSGDGDDPTTSDPKDDQGGGVIFDDGGGGGGGGGGGDNPVVPPNGPPARPPPPPPPPGPGTGGGTPGPAKARHPGGPTTPGPTTPPPVGVGGGGGPTCKCATTSHSVSPMTVIDGFCTIQITFVKTCVPLGTPAYDPDNEIVRGFFARGYSHPGGGTVGVDPGGPQGCVCGTNSCTNNVITLKKACPEGVDEVSKGGGGGAAHGAPKEEQPGGPTTLGEGGGGGGAAHGAPKEGQPGGPTTPGGGGGAAHGAPKEGQPGGPTTPGGGGGAAYGAPGKETEEGVSENDIITQAMSDGNIDLNNPEILQHVFRNKPAGLEDPEIRFETHPYGVSLVSNRSLNKGLFASNIDSNINYILTRTRASGDWDSRRAAGVTYAALERSLSFEAMETIRRIKNFDGTPLSQNQIFSLIGSRILDGTINRLSLSVLQALADESDKRNQVTIIPSNSSLVNEVAALAMIERDMYPLDPTKALGRDINILPNWKTLASDIDKHIDVVVEGEIKKYYVSDDDTFINRSTLSLHDGDYFDVKTGDSTYRLFANSEKDHAFILPEVTRQAVITLLGGYSGRTLRVEADVSSNVEFDHSLSTPRQNFYVLSCVLSSIDTVPNGGGSFLLKDTTARYAIMDTSTTNGLRLANEYIRHKANSRTFILDDEDLILDYIESIGELSLSQTDILYDSPKENKTNPLLTRQLPWYILVYPTNRPDLNIFNAKSKITSLSTSGKVGRVLRCRTSIVPNLSNSLTNKFIRTVTGDRNESDVYGNHNPQARHTEIFPSNTEFLTGYNNNGSLIPAEAFTPKRNKTGLRVLKEIISELDNNYLLGLNGIGKSLTEFDVFSRLTLKQFNILFRLDGFTQIRNSIRNGFINNVKVVPPILNADSKLFFKKTQLVKRKVGAPQDIYFSRKAMKSGKLITPPTTKKGPTFSTVPTNPTSPPI